MAYQKLQVSRAALVTPNDNANITYFGGTNDFPCVLYIGTGGNLRVMTAGGDDVVFSNVLGGTTLPVQVIRVYATNTTASNIVAMW